MTTTRSVTTTARGAGLRALRGNCMGAAVLLVIQFGLGTAVNLYVTLPAHKSFWSTVFSQGMVAVHAIVALLLVGASVSALIRSVRAGRPLVVALTSVGLLAIVVAAASGVAFVRDQSNGASLSMALAAAVALFCYLAAIFALGAGSADTGPADKGAN
jgi:hypothetical protein